MCQMRLYEVINYGERNVMTELDVDVHSTP